MRKKNPCVTLDWVNLLMGSSLAGCSYNFVTRPVVALNALIIGAAVMLISGLGVFSYRTWIKWVNCALGAGTIIQPFLFRYSIVEAPLWINVAVGLTVFLAALVQIFGEEPA